MIVHASERVGLVVVDRSTVTVTAGSITLSFGGYPVELTACVRFLHPLHNFAILSYDPTDLSAEVSAAPDCLLSLQVSGLCHHCCTVAQQRCHTHTCAA